MPRSGHSQEGMGCSVTAGTKRDNLEIGPLGCLTDRIYNDAQHYWARLGLGAAASSIEQGGHLMVTCISMNINLKRVKGRLSEATPQLFTDLVPCCCRFSRRGTACSCRRWLQPGRACRFGSVSTCPQPSLWSRVPG